MAWSADGARLLVLAADPGSYGLDWSARAVVGSAPPADPVVRRPGDARRRLFLIDLASGDATEVGPSDRSVWEADWDGDDTVVALVSEDHTGSGWYQAMVARLDLTARTAETVFEPDWQLDGLTLSPDGDRVAVVEGYASDHGLLSGSVRIIDLGSGAVTDPWPDLQTVGLASWVDADSLWYASTEGTGTACGRISLDGRRDERWRGDAFIGDAITTPACVITADAADIWTTRQAHGEAPELARFDHVAGAWSRRTAFNDHIVEGRVFPEVRVIRWMGEGGVEIEGVLMTPPGAEGPLPTIVCVHGGPTWNWGSYFSDSEPNAVLLASAGYACLLPNPRGSIGRGHAFAQAVIGDGGGVDYRDIMAGVDHVIAEGSGPGPPRHRGALLRRVHGRVGGGAERSVRRGRRDVGGVELRVVPPDVGGVVVRPRDPGGRLARGLQPVRRPVTGHPRAPVHDPDADPAGCRRSLHPARPGRRTLHRDRRDRDGGRARGLPTGGPRSGGAGARARRDRTDASLVRLAPLRTRAREASAEGSEERPDVRDEFVGCLHRGEVAPDIELRPVLDVPVAVEHVPEHVVGREHGHPGRRR